MSTSVGGIFANFFLNTASFEANLKKAEGSLATNAVKMNRALAKVERGFDQVGSGVKRFLGDAVSLKGAIAGLIGGAGLIAGTKAALDFGDAIAKTADRVGLSTDALQELRHAADLTGVSSRLLEDGMQRLNRRVGLLTSTGSSPAKAALEQLGLSTDILSGKLRGTEPIFNAVVKRLGDVKSQADRVAIASQIFGEDAGPKLVALLDQGSAGIGRMRDQARALGIVLDEKLLRGAEAANDQLSTLGRILRTQVTGALLQVAPIIADFGRELAARLPGLVRGMRDFFDALGLGPTSPAQVIETEILATKRLFDEADARARELHERLAEAPVGTDLAERLRQQFEAAKKEALALNDIIQGYAQDGPALAGGGRPVPPSSGARNEAPGRTGGGVSLGGQAAARKAAADAAKKHAEAVRDVTYSLAEEAQTVERDLALIDASEAARQRAATAAGILNRFVRQGIELTAEESDGIQFQLGLIEQRREALNRAEEARKRQEEAVKKAADEAQRAEERRLDSLQRGVEATADAIAGLIAGTGTWKDVTMAALSAVIQRIGDMAKAWAAAQSGGGGGGGGWVGSILTSLFGGGGGGGSSFFSGGSDIGFGGGFGGFSGGLGVPAFHSGGVVGSPPPEMRYPDASGQMRLASNETMAVLKRGETVLPPGANDNRGGGSGAGGGVVVQQTISIDARGNEDLAARLRQATLEGAQLGAKMAIAQSGRLANQGGAYAVQMGRRRG